MKSTLFNMIFVLVLVCAVCAGFLAWTHQMTLAPIAKAKDNMQLEAIAEVIDGDFDNNPFEEKIILKGSKKRESFEFYPAKKDGKYIGVALKTYSNRGFGGRIEMIVGFFVDGRINKFKLISHKETPGLGTKVMEDKFMHQLEDFNPRYGVLKVRQDGGDVDAVTAATISSRAVLSGIQKAFNAYEKLRTGN